MVYCLRLVEPIKDHCFWIMHSNISIDFFSYVYFGKKDIPINNCLNKKIATWKYEIGTNSDKIIPQGIQTPVSRHLFPKGIETRVSWHLFPKGNKTPVSWHLIPKGIKTPVSWHLFPGIISRHLFPNTCFQQESRLWHFRLWSFQGRDTKLERFLAKNQLYSNEITKFWELE